LCPPAHGLFLGRRFVHYTPSLEKHDGLVRLDKPAPPTLRGRAFALAHASSAGLLGGKKRLSGKIFRIHQFVRRRLMGTRKFRNTRTASIWAGVGDPQTRMFPWLFFFFQTVLRRKAKNLRPPAKPLPLREGTRMLASVLSPSSASNIRCVFSFPNLVKPLPGYSQNRKNISRYRHKGAVLSAFI